MARRPSKHTRPPRPLSLGGIATVRTKADGDWQVRTVTGAGAAKDYRCPGCQHLIGTGTPHVVVWRSSVTAWGHRGVEDRRHWHTRCWDRRP